MAQVTKIIPQGEKFFNVWSAPIGFVVQAEQNPYSNEPLFGFYGSFKVTSLKKRGINYLKEDFKTYNSNLPDVGFLYTGDIIDVEMTKDQDAHFEESLLRNLNEDINNKRTSDVELSNTKNQKTSNVDLKSAHNQNLIFPIFIGILGIYLILKNKN